MLDVGFSEILLTSAIALIVLGPERLPKVARQVGNWMGRARAMARQLSEQLEREVSAEELLKTQSKRNSEQSIAPPESLAPPESIAPAPADVPAAPAGANHAPASDAAGVAAPVSEPPEPTYGLPASATTPAAMHASDALAESKPPHE